MLTFPIVPPLHDGYMYIYANIKENKLQVDMNFLYQHSREWFMNVKEYEDCHSYSSKEVNNYFFLPFSATPMAYVSSQARERTKPYLQPIPQLGQYQVIASLCQSGNSSNYFVMNNCSNFHVC